MDTWPPFHQGLGNEIVLPVVASLASRYKGYTRAGDSLSLSRIVRFSVPVLSLVTQSSESTEVFAQNSFNCSGESSRSVAKDLYGKIFASNTSCSNETSLPISARFSRASSACSRDAEAGIALERVLNLFADGRLTS